MAYRNKTYVAFDGEDLRSYNLMKAWKGNENIEFDFYDAHDLNTILDTSGAETVKRSLRERLANTKQVVVLISDTTRSKAGDSSSFLYYEVKVIRELGLPVVFAHLNGKRSGQRSKLPVALLDLYTMNVSFQPKIIQYALDEYVDDFAANAARSTPKEGPWHYKDYIYDKLGL